MSETQLVMFNDLGKLPKATAIDKGLIPKDHPSYDADEPDFNKIPKPHNIDRAEWILEAITVFADRTFGRLDGEDAETVMSDFLGDMQHLCRMNGIDFDNLVERGTRHFEAETADGGNF